MTQEWISALTFPSFSPVNPDGSMPAPAELRRHIADVSTTWQGKSSGGGDAGFRSVERLREAGADSVSDTVNMGSIGEQLALSYAAEQDAQRWQARPPVGDVRASQGLHRMAIRGLCELSMHFSLGAAHSLANTVLRVVLLDSAAAKEIKDSNRFLPGADGKTAWLTFGPTGKFWSMTLPAAAKVADSAAQMTALVSYLGELQSDPRFIALEHRRGMDYHRHRPQSLSHTSPRSGIISQPSPGVTRVDFVPAASDAKSDEAEVHRIAVDAILMLADTMAAMDPLIADAARACDVVWP
jgi:hypothetical protein